MLVKYLLKSIFTSSLNAAFEREAEKIFETTYRFRGQRIGIFIRIQGEIVLNFGFGTKFAALGPIDFDEKRKDLRFSLKSDSDRFLEQR